MFVDEGVDLGDVYEILRENWWKIRYVPHRVIKDYNACYRVVYRGRVIYPPAADVLGIPLNEIWLSEKLRRFERYVLFHEVAEIVFRYLGHDVRGAHLAARVAEAIRFCRDPEWFKYFEEFPDYTVPMECLNELCRAVERGLEFRELLKVLTSCIEGYRQ